MVARLVVLVSGEGTNLQALIDACRDPGYGALVAAVGADRGAIGALARAERAGLPTFTVRRADHPAREDWDLALTRACARHAPDLVVLAGFMKLVGRAFLGLLRRALREHAPGAATVVSRGERRPRRAGPRGEGDRVHPLPRRRGRRHGADPGPGLRARGGRR